MLRLIGELYEVERLVPGPFPGDEEAQKLRLRLRKERSRPILSSIREWALTQRGLPRSDFGKAVRYMLERWAKLTLFVENPLVYPDNNAAERALRGPVVGRKNHYGSRSKRGTDVAALFYTLCETAKLRNVEPRAYLIQAAYAAIEHPGTNHTPRRATRRLRRVASPTARLVSRPRVGHGEYLRLSALAAPVSTAFPGPGSVESMANDVSGTDFAPQRTCRIETSAILHFGSALTVRELCLRNSGSNSSTQTG